MRDVFRIGCVAGVLAIVSLAAQTSGLRIVVIEGEDGINVIQQRTAVQPVIEVRDRNNLPVAGAVVTFSVPASGGATFANSALQLAVTTDAAGRAAAIGLQPLVEGPINLQVTASFQGQTATTTITQTNYATAQAAQAARAQPGSQSGANTGSTGSGAGGGAGAGAGAGAGSAGGLSGAAIGGIAAGGVVGAVAVAKAAGGSSTPPTSGSPATTTVPTTTTVPATTTVPPTTTVPATTTISTTPPTPTCTSQYAALETSGQALVTAINSCATISTPACVNAFIPAFNVHFEALNNLCACLGPSLTPADRANLRDAYIAYQEFAADIGASVPPIPSCFQ